MTSRPAVPRARGSRAVSNEGDALYGEIMRALGRLEEGQARLRDDIESGRESRGRLHEKVDGLREHQARMETDMKATALTAAQARDQSSHAATELGRQRRMLQAMIKRVRRVELRMGLFIAGLSAAGAGLWWLISSNAAAIWNAIIAMLPK